MFVTGQSEEQSEKTFSLDQSKYIGSPTFAKIAHEPHITPIRLLLQINLDFFMIMRCCKALLYNLRKMDNHKIRYRSENRTGPFELIDLRPSRSIFLVFCIFCTPRMQKSHTTAKRRQQQCYGGAAEQQGRFNTCSITFFIIF